MKCISSLVMKFTSIHKCCHPVVAINCSTCTIKNYKKLLGVVKQNELYKILKCHFNLMKFFIFIAEIQGQISTFQKQINILFKYRDFKDYVKIPGVLSDFVFSLTSSGSEKSKIFGMVKFARPFAARKKLRKNFIARELIKRDVFKRKSYSATFGLF